MPGAATELTAVGLPPGLWRLVRDRLENALAALDLAESFGRVVIEADDLPGDDPAWYRLLPPEPGDERPGLALTCHADSFCRRRHLQSTVFPAQAIWEQFEAPLAPQLPDEGTYSALRTDKFLHHHLLTIRDLLDGSLRGQDIPPRLLTAFAAVWAVVVDGRLARMHLPGFDLTERRKLFSRLFSTGGILLPDHWQLLQALWDGAMTEQAAALSVAKRLPRL